MIVPSRSIHRWLNTARRGLVATALFIAATALACSATETGGGSMGPPEAPRLRDSLSPWTVSGIHDAVLRHQPCALEWEQDGPLAVEGPETVDRYEFSDSRQLLRRVRTNYATARSEQERLEYDPDGRLLTEEWGDAEGNVSLTKSFIYEEGRLTEIVLDRPEMLFRIWRLTYDDEGRIETRTQYPLGGDEPKLQVTQHYDALGNHVEDTFDWDLDGLIGWRFSYVYDDRGQLVHAEQYYKPGEPAQESQRYEYDAAGNVTREVGFYKDEKVYTVDYEHDDGVLTALTYTFGDARLSPWRAAALYVCDP